MGATLRRLSEPARPAAGAPALRLPGTGDWTRPVPALTLTLFLLPIGAGLLGTLLPAFGWLPALGGRALGLGPWRALFAEPGLGRAVLVSLVSGVGGSVAALAVVVLFCAGCHRSRLFRRLRVVLAPLLAVPHAAVAIGLAFLIAPSGLLARLVSPWATGWTLPPDVAMVNDPWGLALGLGLAVKELPFLLLMTFGALGQVQAAQRLRTARALGYGPATAWLKTVLPAVWPLVRLPFYAVLAYSLSVVDMAIILGPSTPPSLAVLVVRWFYDPDLSLRFVAAAGALLQLALVAGAIGLAALAERLAARLGRRWLAGGGRGGGGRAADLAGRTAALGALGLGLASLLGIALWSVAWRWRYPEALPSVWSAQTWLRHLDALLPTTAVTFGLGLAATLVALALVVGCLEREQRGGRRPGRGALWLLYLPLLVPQVAFLFGVQVLAVRLGLDGGWLALVWSHLLFVLPYVFLALAEPYRALDPRFGRAARCLGAGPDRMLWRIRLPMLLRPLAFAAAVGFAVSVGQYLPTLFAGGGRVATLTTEAVALSAGGDRRVLAVYAFLQTLLPLLAFLAALALPAWRHRRRRGLRLPS
ncbi:putative thiamine transport system permease protein [Tistlia consotensis]|uniref:Putative thiamine transport system permease protein n=1 Tax=Tistlia consotensis USBA 355 TaxID=560819 RepID=A0A1Y6BFA2_9PROT|nr:ABC transporter permease subunit [Tistlia consotensis]SMF07007.1 putative thiamine transport system permease protein [Tistlia consotensis USBA 355]SNR36137.1 putative thiamine transport system permease protein [Tistlia consotensis]